MHHHIISIRDLVPAVGIPLASISLFKIDEVAAAVAAVLGVVYLSIGIALRWRKWKKGGSE